jgi:hypothetical protein
LHEIAVTVLLSVTGRRRGSGSDSRFKAKEMQRITILALALTELARCSAFSTPCHSFIGSLAKSGVTSNAQQMIGKRLRSIDICMATDNSEVKAFTRRAAILVSAASVIAPQIANSETDAKSASNEYWDNLLKEGKISKKAYEVLHFAATERPNTSPLLKEKRTGIFACAA